MIRSWCQASGLFVIPRRQDTCGSVQVTRRLFHYIFPRDQSRRFIFPKRASRPTNHNPSIPKLKLPPIVLLSPPPLSHHPLTHTPPPPSRCPPDSHGTPLPPPPLPSPTNTSPPSFNQSVLIDTTPLPDSVPKVPEIGASSAPLLSASFFIGARCAAFNDDYMKCKTEAHGKGEIECMREGRKVTRCAASV